MAKIYVFLADGCEEVEAMTPVDILRRAGHTVCTVSITGKELVTGANGIRLAADALLENVDGNDGDVFLLPGGMPGTLHLGECAALTSMLKVKYQEGKRIAAICAAPSVLGALGFLQGRKAVCYPGMEEKLTGAQVQNVPTVSDGNITTAKGVGAAIDFGLELVRLLDGQEKALEIKEQIVYPG